MSNGDLRLRLGLGQSREHKFRYDSNDALNPLQVCDLEPKTT